MKIRFDDSLPALARIIVDEIGALALPEGVVLRDAVGRLAFYTPVEMSREIVDRISLRLRVELGPYARTDRVMATATEIGVQSLLHDSSAVRITVGEYTVRLIDRRIVGADWLRRPASIAGPPPRFVFSSLKGGVGRSTALSITAAHLAAHGKRVLAIDLDMEAPGLSAILLDKGTTPKFGIIDALVENGLSGLDDEFYSDLVGPSNLADRHGRIDVIPAFGTRSIENPADVLAKIARAYAEDVRPDGTVATLMDQIREIVDYLTDLGRYDAILIDARAGLHETTASAILGLGADVYLFGLDDKQTFLGYAALLAHLARFIDPTEPTPEWVDRLTMVQGKAPPSVSDRAAFSEKCRSLFLESGLATRSQISEPLTMPAEPFANVPWEEDDDAIVLEDVFSGRDPLAILEDEQFRKFEPLRQRDLLSQHVYDKAYGIFLDRVNDAFKFEDVAHQ